MKKRREKNRKGDRAKPGVGKTKTIESLQRKAESNSNTNIKKISQLPFNTN